MSKCNCGCCEHEHEHEHEHNHNHNHEKADSCGCGHEHDHPEENKGLSIALTVTGAVLVGVSFLPFLGETIKTVLLIAATVICGLPVFIDGIKALMKKNINESVLLIIAVVAALFLGEFVEAAVVCVLFRVGEIMEDFASGKSRESIESLYGIVSDTANAVMPDGSFRKVDADEIKIGDVIAILPHETVPVDCIVKDGEGAVDASALTGEALPVAVAADSVLSSGMINGSTTLIATVTAEKEGSAASRIVEMVEKATLEKGEAQRAVSVFAKYYTPAIIVAALIIAVVPSLITGEWSTWIYRSLILLVAACPCAVVISAPLAFFSSMGACAKNGIIIKGSRFIESMAVADTAVFDKTGTLTTGELTVGKVCSCGSLSEEKVLALAAKCEYYSTHPIAKAIVRKSGLNDISGISDFSEISGGGTSVTAEEGKIVCGGKRLMNQLGTDVSSLPELPVYVAVNSVAVGGIEVEGEIREDSARCIENLKKLGVKRIFMLTGDSRVQAEKISLKCGITDFKCNLMPEDKLSEIRKIKESSKGVIYVGDGINDAPVLAAADTGVAMGLGTQAAGEAADVVLTNSVISKLAEAVRQSKKTMTVLKSNIAFAVIVKIAVISLGVAGIAPMWMAIVADVGTMLVSVANSARLLNVKIR